MAAVDRHVGRLPDHIVPLADARSVSGATDRAEAHCVAILHADLSANTVGVYVAASRLSRIVTVCSPIRSVASQLMSMASFTL